MGFAQAPERAEHGQHEHRDGHHEVAGGVHDPVALCSVQDGLGHLGGDDLARILEPLRDIGEVGAGVVDEVFVHQPLGHGIVEAFGGAANLGHHQPQRALVVDRTVRDHARDRVADHDGLDQQPGDHQQKGWHDHFDQDVRSVIGRQGVELAVVALHALKRPPAPEHIARGRDAKHDQE